MPGHTLALIEPHVSPTISPEALNCRMTASTASSFATTSPRRLRYVTRSYDPSGLSMRVGSTSGTDSGLVFGHRRQIGKAPPGVFHLPGKRAKVAGVITLGFQSLKERALRVLGLRPFEEFVGRV